MMCCEFNLAYLKGAIAYAILDLDHCYRRAKAFIHTACFPQKAQAFRTRRLKRTCKRTFKCTTVLNINV